MQPDDPSAAKQSPLTAAQRQARSRAARKEGGGRAVHVLLTAAAAQKLAAWESRGESTTAIICRLLSRSRP